MRLMEERARGGKAETTEPNFSHHLARTDPFELADSPPPDVGSSHE